MTPAMVLQNMWKFKPSPARNSHGARHGQRILMGRRGVRLLRMVWNCEVVMTPERTPGPCVTVDHHGMWRWRSCPGFTAAAGRPARAVRGQA